MKTCSEKGPTIYDMQLKAAVKNLVEAWDLNRPIADQLNRLSQVFRWRDSEAALRAEIGELREQLRVTRHAFSLEFKGKCRLEDRADDLEQRLKEKTRECAAWEKSALQLREEAAAALPRNAALENLLQHVRNWRRKYNSTDRYANEAFMERIRLAEACDALDGM